MIVYKQPRHSCRAWQKGFLTLLPQIEQLLQLAFSRLDDQEREESIQNGIVLSLLSYIRLHERGRAGSVSASNLAWFAALQTKVGRVAGGQLNADNPLSRYAQLRRRNTATSLHPYNSATQSRVNTIVADRRAPIPDVVAARLDIRAWLATLCRRTRQIACDLAKGWPTADAARKYRISPSRISQMRRELELSWSAFQGEPVISSSG